MEQALDKTVPELFEYARGRFEKLDTFVRDTVKDAYFREFDGEVPVGFVGKELGLIMNPARPADERITDAVDVADAGKNRIAYLTRPAWLADIEKHPHLLEASCLIIEPKFLENAKKAGLTCHFIVSGYPKIVFVEILELAHKTTVIEETRADYLIDGKPKLGTGTVIHPSARFGNNVEIGDRSAIGHNCYVGSDVKIGRDVMIFPNVTIMPKSRIGDRVILQSGVVVGSDGFGYTQVGYRLNVDATMKDSICATTRHPDFNPAWPVHGFVNYKHPHFGPAIIENDVEMGANSVVDRGQHLPTIVGTNTKADKAVYIAHNDRIGASCIFCGQTACGGNVKIGSQVMCAAKVGIRDNTSVGDRCLIEAMSGVGFDLPPGRETYAGRPAVPSKVHWKSQKIQHEHLDNHHKSIRFLLKLLDNVPTIDPDDISDEEILAFIRTSLPTINAFKRKMHEKET